MSLIEPCQTLFLPFPPSCLEFCPQFQELFVVGTYHLHKQDDDSGNAELREVEDRGNHEISTDIGDQDVKPQKRSGSLVIFRVNGGDERKEVQELSTCSIPSAAILDLHFLTLSGYDEPLILTALSTGCLGLHALNPQPSPALEQLSLLQIEDQTILILSLTLHPTDPFLIGYTTSTGSVSIVRLLSPTDQESWKTQKLATLIEHDLEAFTMKFLGNHNVSGSFTVFSGGDDAALMCSSLKESPRRSGGSDDEENDLEQKEGWIDIRTHGAGVTSILPLSSEVILTGSYDDTIRVLSFPLPAIYNETETIPKRRVKVLEELDLGGGVWCLRLVSEDQHSEDRSWTILACCMYVGARLLRIKRKDDEWTVEILAEVKVHESMCYAADVIPSSSKSNKWFISTSFYDKRVCLWSINM